MKKTIQILSIVVAAILLTSCLADDSIDTYSGEDTIYFPNEDGDSLMVSFGFFPDKTDSLVKIPVQIMGMPVDTDRPYDVSITENSTAEEGVHFDFSENEDFMIPADSVLTSLKVILHNTADLDTDTVSIAFKLNPNEHFSTRLEKRTEDESTGKTVSYTSFSLLSNDVLSRPIGWRTSTYEYNGIDYLGRFTEKKLFLIVEVLDIEPSIFISSVPDFKLRYFGSTMQRYLDQQEGNGNTIYEEDGTKMIMGEDVQ